MPKLTYLYVFSILMLLAACSVRRAGTPARGLPELASDSNSLQEASRIHAFVQSLTPHTFSGALVVDQHNGLVLASGYGYAQWEKQEPFSVQTVSHTAELAKQFTAAAILKLQAQGRLKVEDSLGSFFTDVPAAKKGIRLRQLLTHTAGLPADIANAGTPMVKEVFLKQLWEAPLHSRPGERYLYSHAAYRLLAAVVEAVANTSYEEFIGKEFLEPANLATTGYLLPGFDMEQLAKEQGVQFSQEAALPDYASLAPALWHIMGSSGMLSNAVDIYRWNSLLLEGDLLPDKERRMLWEDREGVPPGASAYGWVLASSPENTPLLMHTSRVGSFVSQLLYYPREKIRISLLANKANHQVEHLGQQLGRMLLMPQYAPAPMPYGEQKFVRIPQGDEAESLRALTRYVQEKGESDPKKVLENYYSTDLKKAASEQTHVQVLKQLRQRLSKASIERVGQAWPSYSLTLYAPDDNIWYRLRVGVEPPSPYRITSIALETTDPF